MLVGPVSSSILDLGHPVYRIQLSAEFIYGLLSAKLANEEVRHENRGGAGTGKSMRRSD
jgi:hypothetical protein